MSNQPKLLRAINSLCHRLPRTHHIVHLSRLLLLSPPRFSQYSSGVNFPTQDVVALVSFWIPESDMTLNTLYFFCDFGFIGVWIEQLLMRDLGRWHKGSFCSPVCRLAYIRWSVCVATASSSCDFSILSCCIFLVLSQWKTLIFAWWMRNVMTR